MEATPRDAWIVSASESFVREWLRRVIAVVNRKGGVGKTTIVANMAGILAAAGNRVLVVDLDNSGNVGLNLGYRKSDVDDEGFALMNALITGSTPEPVKDVRPNLDVLPGGHHVGRAMEMLAYDARSGRKTNLALAAVLAPLAKDYDIVLIDLPPGDSLTQQQALVAARWVLIPVESDVGAVDGIELLLGPLDVARELNPDIEILGAAMSKVKGQSNKWMRTRDAIEEMVGDAFPVFNTRLREAATTIQDARLRGQLHIEIERVTDSAAGVTEDMVNLTEEIITRLYELEGRAA